MGHMNKIKKYIIVTTLAAMFNFSCQDVNAQEYYIESGGCAYEDTYQSCLLAPAVTFALVAIAAIIAVGVHNRSKSSHD